jgi:hypothetical protein
LLVLGDEATRRARFLIGIGNLLSGVAAGGGGDTEIAIYVPREDLHPEALHQLP